MCFLCLLLAGMVRVCLSGLDGWSRVNRTLTAQRALRWSMDRLAGDLRMLGHLFPPPELRTLPASTGPGPPPGGFTLVPGPTDELSFVMDAPVPATATLDSALAGAGEATVRVRPAGDLSLEAGDLLLVAGGRFEFARVAAPADLEAGGAGPVAVAREDGTAGPPFAFPHPGGALVQAVRPLRLVRYGVAPVVLEPGGGPPVPCLVRFEAGCPGPWATAPWPALLKAPRATGARHELLAENVTRFRVDYAPDGRFPGIRGGAAASPSGFRNRRGLFQVELETASPGAPGSRRRGTSGCERAGRGGHPGGLHASGAHGRGGLRHQPQPGPGTGHGR